MKARIAAVLASGAMLTAALAAPAVAADKDALSSLTSLGGVNGITTTLVGTLLSAGGRLGL